MSFKFQATPKVVQSRSKYRDAKPSDLANLGSSSTGSLLKDPRITMLSPTQQEEEFVRIEKDRIKLENMQKQLVAFKANKKMSPYNIKPSPIPKVNANLTFFLTDSTDTKAHQTSVDIQTDIWKEKPKTPPYIPKKTGRDVSTQIEDNELFNFDREVTPIIDVIVTKTVEQSLIEIEEEEEIRRIQEFKEQYWKRRQEDEQKWKAMLDKEIEAIAAKEKKLEEYTLREERRIQVLRKLQAYQISRLYLRDLGINAVSFLQNNGLNQNEQREEMANKLPQFFAEGIIDALTRRQQAREAAAVIFNHIEGELMARREKADQIFKNKQQKRMLKRFNQAKDQKLVRFIYQDDSTPATHFGRFISKMQEQDLAAFFEDYKARVAQLKERLDNGELTEEDYPAARAAEFPEMEPATNLRVVLDDFKKLSFNVANNMFYAEPKREGFFDISIRAFGKQGNFLYQVDKNNTSNASKSIKYIGNVKDSKIKVSDDFGMKINLPKIEEEVNHLVLTVEIENLEQSIAAFNDFLRYSRFRLCDFVTDQTLEETNIFSNFKLEELKDASAESELGGKIICYYLYRAKEIGWVFESVQSFKNVPIETENEFNGTVEKYIKACLEEQYGGAEEEQEEADDEASPEAKQTSEAKPTNRTESQKPEGEKEEEVTFGVKFNTRTFGYVELDVADGLEVMKEKIDEVMQRDAPLLHQSFEHGYELVIGESEFVRATQIRKIGGITSFVVRRKPKPVEEVAFEEGENGEGEGEEGEEQEGSEEEEN